MRDDSFNRGSERVRSTKLYLRFLYFFGFIIFLGYILALIQRNKHFNQEHVGNFRLPANVHAPIYVTDSLLVPAPPEVVWSELADISSWAEWNLPITDTRPPELFVTGTFFEFQQNGVWLDAQMHTLHSPSLLGMEAEKNEVYLIQTFTLIPQPNGTMVVTRKSVQGFLPFLFMVSRQKKEKVNVSESLKGLKQRSVSSWRAGVKN